MQRPEKIKKPRSPKKDLLFGLLLLAVAVALLIAAINITPAAEEFNGLKKSDALYKELTSQKYFGQVIYIGAVLALLGSIYFLFFFVKEKYGEQILAVLKKVGSFLSFILEWVYRFICKILGIDPDRFFARGKDKRSFRRRRTADDDGIRLTNPLGKRYKDMEDNLQRIRFLYKKFLQKIIKKGYKFKYARTPVEVRAQLIEEEYLEKEDQHLLVNLYVDNRYARPERIHITDEDVEVCRNVK